MELLFVWINDFRNIKGKGYNLSRRYDISYDKEQKEISVNDINGKPAIANQLGKLKLNVDKDYLDNFFTGNISNISALIGKNSTGKSNVLDLILTALHKGKRQKIKSDYFLLFQEKNEIKFSGRIKGDSVKNSTLKCLGIELKKIEPNKNWFSIFYSNVADNRNYLFEDIISHDYSFEKIQKSQSNKLEYVSSDDFQITWDRITNKKENSQIVRFELNPLVFNRVRTKNNGKNLNGIYKRYHKAIYLESSSNSNKYKYTLTISLFCYLFEEGYFLENETNSVRILTNTFAENISTLQPKIYHILKKIPKEKFDSDNLTFSEFNLFIELIDRFDKTKSRFGLNEKNDSFVIADYDDDFKAIIKGFITVFDKTDIIQHDWAELSSGMKAYLSLYSNLFSAAKTINLNPNKSVILCIDEGDLYMHPEWQRNFLNDLIKFLQTNFKSEKIQLILTSHSPFLISDLPKECVILLGKDGVEDRQINEKSSFGANIHQLFSNQFFLSENGTMGAFAKEKILNLFNKIPKTKQTDLTDTENLIAMVGEPVLRYRLEDKLEKHISDNFEAKDRIEWHKKQIKLLATKK